ncbi:DUF302 domain-containing protein [Halorhabdus sp. CUG00001]|uniref:DUF302 domain-containing protein n=1 Tax=Halorhabdus sp. CUG00001 TaxID=2600297 RepID=UPI00131E6A71|nr:DUF302 domain-containing protein [Halorhabdus sp. CUG00001]
MATYVNQYRVDAAFAETIETVTDALAEEGFGVLADIDIQAAFETKLDEDFDRYRILGACNPALASDALDAEYELGALLPCNVVVYEDEAGVGINVVDPATLFSLTDSDGLEAIVDDVASGLDAAMHAVPEATPVSQTDA